LPIVWAVAMTSGMQKPEATRVAGFRTWLKLGYCMRRGERAIRIWIPIPPSKLAIERCEA
jgi:hypothetical protein